MKNILLKSLLGFTLFLNIFITNCYACEDHISYQNNESVCHESHHVYVENLDDVIVNDSEIFFSFHGDLFQIRSIEKIEKNWKIRLAYQLNCPRGHSLCRYCNMCHFKGCFYEVRGCAEFRGK